MTCINGRIRHVMKNQVDMICYYQLDLIVFITTLSTNTTYRLLSVLALQFLTGLEDCTCYDFGDRDGYGNCLKGHPNKNGLLVCYVKQPTSCNDTIDNLSFPGREISSLAC